MFTAKTAKKFKEIKPDFMTILVLISLEVAQKQVTWFFREISSWYLMILMILISLRTWEFRSLFLEKIKWLEFFATSRVIRTRILRKSVPILLFSFFALQRPKKEKKKACGIGLVLLELKFHSFISSFVISLCTFIYIIEDGEGNWRYPQGITVGLEINFEIWWAIFKRVFFCVCVCVCVCVCHNEKKCQTNGKHDKRHRRYFK